MPYALVMGASGDIGQAVCEKLAGQGWSLYCHYNHQKEKVLNFVSDLQKRYPQQDFFMVSLDMLKETEVPSFLEQLFQVDGIVFASGFTFYELLPGFMASSFEDTATFITEFAGEIGKKWKWARRIYRIGLWTSWKQHGDCLQCCKGCARSICKSLRQRGRNFRDHCQCRSTRCCPNENE